jgi:hypothetical protein
MKSILIAVFLAFASSLWAATPQELIAQLASDQAAERTAAIEGLRKLGDAAVPALRKVRESEELKPRQLMLVRRLLGDALIVSSPLKPLDLGTLSPYGEDKKAGVAGDPNLLMNKDTKVIALDGSFVNENCPLEFLVVSRIPNARLHETVIAVTSLARDICTALLVCAFTYAGELGEDVKIELPKDAGVMVSAEFLWEPPHANMEPTLEAPALIWEMLDKHAAAKNANPTDRATLLWDLEGDVAALRNIIAVPQEKDDAARQAFLQALQKQVEKEKCVYDEQKRDALMKSLTEYLKLENGGVAPERKGPAGPRAKKMVRVPVEYFAWNTSTERPMRRVPFAFTGSRFEKDPNTGKMLFMADIEGSIVALKLDAYAVLNTLLDTRNIDPQHAAGYALNADIISHRLAKCRLVFEPWTGGDLKEEDLKDIGEKKTSGMAIGAGKQPPGGEKAPAPPLPAPENK